MHTILGANGIIGEELAKALREKYTEEIRLVGRNPKKVSPKDELVPADLLFAESTSKALEGTEIAYLTVGLPFSSEVWLRDWAIIMENVIQACQENNCKLVYFDNTYAFPQDYKIQREDTPMTSSGKKGIGKKRAFDLLEAAIDLEEIEAVIVRAPEFYGPGKTKSITNNLVFERIQKGLKPRVFLRDDTLRTLIYTPDASKATALVGNTSDCYGESWHLPCDDHRLTYKQIMEEVGKQLGRKLDYEVLSRLKLRVAALSNPGLKETMELLARYEIDNIFDSSKFKNRFPDFVVTSYLEGISAVLNDMGLLE